MSHIYRDSNNQFTGLGDHYSARENYYILAFVAVEGTAQNQWSYDTAGVTSWRRQVWKLTPLLKGEGLNSLSLKLHIALYNLKSPYVVFPRPLDWIWWMKFRAHAVMEILEMSRNLEIASSTLGNIMEKQTNIRSFGNEMEFSKIFFCIFQWVNTFFKCDYESLGIPY